jgi:hypothetical protein
VRNPRSSGEFHLCVERFLPPQHSSFSCSSEAALKSRTEPAARQAGDLHVYVTKLELCVANRCGRGYLGLAQARHLVRRFLFDAGTPSRERVAVAAVRVGLALAQFRQQARQLGSSLLQFRSLSSHGFLRDLRLVVRHVSSRDRCDESSGSGKLAFFCGWGGGGLCWDQG